jgi:hypothetical protein
MAKNGEFYPIEELSCITVEGFNASKLIYTENPSSEIIKLFRLLGVKIIDRVILRFSNSMKKMDSLGRQLNYIAPLLALIAVEKSKNRKEWENEFGRIKRNLSAISFYETTEIYISYGDTEDEQKRSTWAENNNFYYVGNWQKPRILAGLVEPLCRFLNIRNAERDLTVLLTEEFSESIQYLEEKGFDIKIIPDDRLNPQNPFVKFEPIDSDYTISREDIGKKGEIFVFEQLKQNYKEKYQKPVEETPSGFKIGDDVEVIWRNMLEVSGENHDFKIIESGKEIYIDSKATPSSKNVEKIALYVTASELSLMEKAEKYLIARVFNVINTPEIEFIQMKIGNLN